MAYLHYFGRDTYQLPGVQSLAAAAALIARSLFVGPADELVADVFVNSQWTVARHELEYGVTWVPLLLLLLGGVAGMSRAREQAGQGTPKDWLQYGALVALLLLPMVLNYYTPQWHTLLKHLPILKNSSLLIRWVSLYIPVVILLAAVGLDRMVSLRPYHASVVLLSLAAVVLLNSHADRAYYHTQPYDPQPIVQAYHRVQRYAWTPTIRHIAGVTTPARRALMPLARNDVIVQGGSQLRCYEPLFGYRLEKFPRGTLSPGAVMEERNGYFNLKNPACYVYPAANGCTPGAHFALQQRPAAEAFITYQPFPFHVPGWQTAANLLTLTAAAGVLGFLIAAPLWRWR
jgi:hypothetical protein